MSAPSHQLFANARIDQEFLREGYIRMPLLEAWEVDQLMRVYLGAMPDVPAVLKDAPDVLTGNAMPSDAGLSALRDIGPGKARSPLEVEERRRLARTIEDVLAPHLAGLLPRYNLCSVSFATRGGVSGQAPVGLSQELTTVDPARHRAVQLWIPLVDVEARSGSRTVVARSHRVIRHLAAIDAQWLPVGSPWDAYREVLEAECRVSLPMKRGEAFFFDQRLLQGATGHRGPGMQVAVVAALLPAGVRPRLYLADAEDATRLHVVEVEDGDLGLQLPDRDAIRALGTVHSVPEVLTEEQVARLRVNRARLTPSARPVGEPIRPVLSRLRGLVHGGL
jgi:hypothetical protein